MMHKIANLRVFLFGALLALLVSTNAMAQQQQASLQSAVDTNNQRVLGMVTGSKTGTYYRIGKDIADIISPTGLSVDVKTSSGSIDNIGRIGSRENAAMGIVQSDVLGFLKRSDAAESKKMAKNLRMVFPLYQEEVHVVANNNITDFRQLDGRTISVGETGSGSWLTAMNLFSLAGIKPAKILRVSPEEGLVSVLRGQADAMLFVSGKPVKLFENLTKLQKHKEYESLLANIHFLALDNPSFYQEYDKATIFPNDYSFNDETVSTIAVTALMVSYNFADKSSAYADQRCRDMRSFAETVQNNLRSLRANSHPKWKEVNLNTEVLFWERDPCAITETRNTRLESELLGILKNED